MIKLFIKWQRRWRQRRTSKALIAQVTKPKGEMFQPAKTTQAYARKTNLYQETPTKRPFWKLFFIILIVLVCLGYFVWESLAGVKLFQS